MTKKNTKGSGYKDAIDSLKLIVDKLKNDEISIDELVKEVDTAQKLIKQCKEVLRNTELDLDEIIS